MIILDTNVLSEIFKPAPSARVLTWLGSREPDSVFLTAVTQAEILYGIELLPAGRPRNSLSNALEKVFAEDFPDRILAFDEHAARIYSKLATRRSSLGRPISQSDAMIAAIARSRGYSLATRNTGDFERCGLEIVNPWEMA